MYVLLGLALDVCFDIASGDDLGRSLAAPQMMIMYYIPLFGNNITYFSVESAVKNSI